MRGRLAVGSSCRHTLAYENGIVTRKTTHIVPCGCQHNLRQIRHSIGTSTSSCGINVGDISDYRCFLVLHHNVDRLRRGGTTLGILNVQRHRVGIAATRTERGGHGRVVRGNPRLLGLAQCQTGARTPVEGIGRGSGAGHVGPHRSTAFIRAELIHRVDGHRRQSVHRHVGCSRAGTTMIIGARHNHHVGIRRGRRTTECDRRARGRT